MGLGRPLRWRYLSKLERRAIANGCGGKGGKVPVPDFLFTASCDHHDFNYWLGGSERDRRKADWQFYQAMLEDVHAQSIWVRPLAYMAAWLYYKAVRRFARQYFNYGPPRDWEDLWRELGK